jgi:hypothetical protein
MSTKINLYLPAAAAAAGVTTTAAAAIADGLLSVKQISVLSCAEINDGSGKVMVFATIKNADDTESVRPVAGSDGNVKLYSNASAALKLSKSANLLPGAVIQFTPYAKVAAVGDPLEGLKTRYKTACGKGFAAQSKLTVVQSKIDNAGAFGWDTSTGATLAEYNDLQARATALTEWESEALALVDTLADRLTTAGVDPTTLGPRPTLAA